MDIYPYSDSYPPHGEGLKLALKNNMVSSTTPVVFLPQSQWLVQPTFEIIKNGKIRNPITRCQVGCNGKIALELLQLGLITIAQDCSVFKDLPDEILEHIFSFLYLRDREHIRLTCRRFAAIFPVEHIHRAHCIFSSLRFTGKLSNPKLIDHDENKDYYIGQGKVKIYVPVGTNLDIYCGVTILPKGNDQLFSLREFRRIIYDSSLYENTKPILFPDGTTRVVNGREWNKLLADTDPTIMFIERIDSTPHPGVYFVRCRR